MRNLLITLALALLALPVLVAAQPAPPQPPVAPAPAAQPGTTVAPAQAPAPPAQPAAPKKDEDRRIILSTQPGDTAEPDATLHYKGPKFAWEGGELNLSIPGWYPELGLPPLLSATWGMWAGGRGTVFIMPLGDRLKLLTDPHGLDSFEGEIFTIGPRFMFEVDKTLRISFYFDTGSQDVDQNVNGHQRQAHVNLTRLGMGFEALQPISHLIKLSPEAGSPKFPFFRPGDIKIGMGIELGGGNLNLSYRGHAPDNDWTHNEPLMYMTPMGIASVPLTKWSTLDFYAGYQFVRMNEFSLQYVSDNDKIKGHDFDGWVGGVQLMFGTNAINELRRKDKGGGG